MMRSLRYAVAIGGALSVTVLLGCVHHFAVEPRIGGGTESRPLAEEMVHPGRRANRDTWMGPNYPAPYTVVQLNTSEDLQLLADEMDVNAVRYNVYVCSRKRSKRISVLNGPVFRSASVASETDRHSLLIFLPTDVRTALKYEMGLPGQPDLEKELRSAESDGLCVVVSGGGWFAPGFSSKPARIPVSFDGAALSESGARDSTAR